LPDWAFISAPTIEGLAHHLRLQRFHPEETTIVPLAEGRETKVFAVPGQAGRALPFMALAGSLSEEVSLYGFDDPELRAGHKGAVEDVAARFVQLLVRAEPPPYRLIGFSFGGVVAFEMARRLASQGNEVSFVGVIDTRDLRSPIADRLRKVTGSRSFRKALRARLERSLYAGLGWANRTLHVPIPVERRAKVSRSSAARRVTGYETAGYPGRVDYFRVVRPGRAPDELSGWLRVAPDIHIHDVASPTHGSVMRPPWVAGLADSVRAALAEAGAL
jgi:thioesterase domain-containing protein